MRSNICHVRFFAAFTLLAVTLSACGGGAPVTDAAISSSPSGDEIEMHLDAVLIVSDTEIYSSGGDLAVCQGPGCNTLDRIFFSPSTGRLEALDKSGFEFVEERRGVLFAEKVSLWQRGDEREESRTLAGWLDQTMFLFATRRGYDQYGIFSLSYHLNSTGSWNGTNPASPVSGSATWSGAMAGVVLPDVLMGNGGDFVSGDARITIPRFGTNAEDPSLNLEFSNIVNASTGDHLSNMSWEGLKIVEGSFGYARDASRYERERDDFRIIGREEGVAGQLYGQFHGPNHDEAGGQFIRDGIVGAFAASRDE